jgi:hypothetical protein
MNRNSLLKTAAAMVMLTATAAFAQLSSNSTSVTLNATVSESLTVLINSGSVVNFGTLTAGAGATTNIGNVPINVTTSWNLGTATGNSVKVYAFFATPSQALSNGTNYIPAADVMATVNSGTPAALTGSFGTLPIDSATITNSTLQGTLTDSIALGLNLSSFTSATLPAGTYTGTLYIQAQAAS